MTYYSDYIDKLHDVLSEAAVTLLNGDHIPVKQGYSLWCEWTADIKKDERSMYMIGNGASAMMASHMAADASKNGEFRCLAFNDAALLTAVSNDICYEQSFAMPIKRFARQDDMLVAISSSGNSPNIVAGINAAREIGLKVLTLSGMGGDNKIRQMGDLNFHLPGETYGLVETSHQVVLHCWLDRFIERENTGEW